MLELQKNNDVPFLPSAHQMKTQSAHLLLARLGYLVVGSQKTFYILV